MKRTLNPGISEVENTKTFQVLLKDIRELIENARQNVAAAVNTGLSILYWQVGERIRKDILNEKRAAYGRQILPTLSAKLVPKFRKRLVNDFSLVPPFLIFFIVPFFFFLLLKVEKISQKGYNHNMPKLYEYFGLIVLFYSNDHGPIHVHGKYQGKESKS